MHHMRTARGTAMAVAISLMLGMGLSACGGGGDDSVTAVPLPNASTPAAVGSYDPTSGPRAKVFMINDTAGDPDGLVANAHAALSKSTQLVGVVGTPGSAATRSTAAQAKEKADKVLELAGVTGVPTYAGAETKLTDMVTPIRSAGAEALVAAANAFKPFTGKYGAYSKLFVTVGGGLTDVASALLIDPTIASKITVVWIGGGAYPNGSSETNFGIDPFAARVVFNASSVEIWQVPSTAYSQSLVSMTEMKVFVRPFGSLGQFLYDSLVTGPSYGSALFLGETWSLGDNPLVLLTALTNWGSSSGTDGSSYTTRQAPLLNADGTYDLVTTHPYPRKIRVYDSIDSRTMLSDFFAKMEANFPLH